MSVSPFHESMCITLASVTCCTRDCYLRSDNDKHSSVLKRSGPAPALLAALQAVDERTEPSALASEARLLGADPVATLTTLCSINRRDLRSSSMARTHAALAVLGCDCTLHDLGNGGTRCASRCLRLGDDGEVAGRQRGGVGADDAVDAQVAQRAADHGARQVQVLPRQLAGRPLRAGKYQICQVCRGVVDALRIRGHGSAQITFHPTFQMEVWRLGVRRHCLRQLRQSRSARIVE